MPLGGETPTKESGPEAVRKRNCTGGETAEKAGLARSGQKEKLHRRGTKKRREGFVKEVYFLFGRTGAKFVEPTPGKGGN